MNKKHLFASAVVAAVLAGCSQDELIVNNDMQTLEDRPMVEAPVLTVGGVESRMTTTGNYAKVEWQAGDGFGAAVIDTYDAAGTTWATKFPIVSYINSNVLFKTEDGSSFYAEASMPMGNHLFYAPFNLNNISRDPLATQVPLNQVIVASTNGEPSNSAITAFYEDKTSPVFVAYDKVTDAPKTSLDLEMRHIYSLPLVTMELGEVQLLDAEGELKTVKVEENGTEVVKNVYENEITIEAIKFVQNKTAADKKIVTKGYINNANVVAKLAKTENGVVWDASKYENAATADIVDVAKTTETVYPYETITVTFDGGLKLTEANNGKFFMVLPGADYEKKDLAVYVYATINGESYVSATNSKDGTAKVIEPARAARLLPGLPYTADEYNANGTKKESAGTSMTYRVSCGFIPTETAEVETTGYVDIKTYEELVEYVSKVAYRGETLKQITKEQAIAKIEAETYDKKAEFVITATEAAPIALDGDFVTAFKNSCVVTGKTAKIEFISAKNLVIGDMTWTKEASDLIKFSGNAYAAGEVVLKANPAATVNVLATANVTLDAAMETAVTVINAANGTVNLNSAKAHQIWNDFGTVNMNVSSAADVWNGYTAFNTDKTNIGVLTIADGVENVGDIKNRVTGEVTVNDAIITMENAGKVTMNAASAQLTASGTGEVNNTNAAKVISTTNVVYANVNNLDLSGYDEHTGLNKLVLNAVLTCNNGGHEGVTHMNFNGHDINTIDFAEGSGINYANIAGCTLNLVSVETINILADMTWKGRDYATTTITVAPNAIKVAEDCELTLTNINVNGYETIANNLVTLNAGINAGGNVDLGASVALENTLNISKEVTLNLNNNTITAGVFTESGGDIDNAGTNDSFAIWAKDGAKITIDGEGTIEAQDAKYSMAVYAQGGEVTIKGGKFTNKGNNCDLIYATGNAKIKIEGGEFKANGVGDPAQEGTQNYNSVLNIKDADRATASIVVTGGKFWNFNPANNVSEGANTNFVAPGYKVRTIQVSTGEQISADAKAVYTAATHTEYGDVIYEVYK